MAAVLTIAAAQAEAQNSKPLDLNNPFSRLKPNTRLILSQQLQSAQKGTAATDERLIGYSSYQDYGETFVDSNHYVYSGSRFANVTNLNPFSYMDEFDPIDPLAPEILSPLYINYLQYDTSYYYQDSGPSIGDLSVTRTKLYDDQNRLTTALVEQPGLYKGRILISYKGMETLVDSVLMQQDTSSDMSGMYETVSRMVTGYDLTGKRIADTVYDLESGEMYVNHYTYTSGGQLAQTTSYNVSGGSSSSPTSRTTYTYDVMGRLLASLEEYDSGSGLMNDYLDSFTYSGANMMYTSDKSFSYADTSWILDVQIVNSLTSFDAIDSSIISADIFETGALMEVAKLKFTYNANQHMTKQALYFTDGTEIESDPTQIQHFYYAPVPTSVAGLPSQQAGISLYPNPATNVLTISGKGNMQVSVYNLSGQLLLQQSGPAQQEGMQVQISSLPAGTYLAEVKTKDGRANLKFVKQ